MVNITLIVFFLIGAIGVAYCSYKNVIEKKQQEKSGKEVKQKVDLTLFFAPFMVVPIMEWTEQLLSPHITNEGVLFFLQILFFIVIDAVIIFPMRFIAKRKKI